MHIAKASILAGSILIVAASGMAPVRAQSTRDQSVAERREAAVRQARAGQTDEAIAALRAMLASGADDGKVAMDLTALLQQAGRPEEAVAAFAAAKPAAAPDYALLAAARAFRDLKRYADAEVLARTGMFRFPDQPVWPLLLALVLSDAGRPQQALEVLAQPAAMRASALERALAEGYALRRADQSYEALAAYLKALDLAPDNAEARTAAADILRGLGGVYGAAAIAGPGPPSPADEAAAKVRWAKDTRPRDPALRFAATDAALARLDALLAALPASDGAQRRRLKLDRVAALRDRVRMKEAVAEAEALRAEGPLTAYAEVAYGDALVYVRRPEDAAAAYRRALALTPGDLDARYGLFFALTDIGDFKAAYGAIDALVDDEPVWRLHGDEPGRHANPERAYAEVTAANARYNGDQLAEAWDRLTQIAETAPANPWARLGQSQVANARGWPRLAEAEAEIALSLDPDATDAKTALAEIAMANYRFAEARRKVASLVADFPEDGGVQRLARDLRADTGWTFEGLAEPSDSEGGGANATGPALTALTKLTTPPVADHWRLYAVAERLHAHPPEGYVQRSRLTGGVEWRSTDLTATFYGGESWQPFIKPGFGGALDWSPNDQLRLGVAAERYSWDTPLRAVLHRITADSVSASATWRWSESRDLSGSVSYMHFSDGNHRFRASLQFNQKVVERPGFNLVVGGETYSSRNDLAGAPYFNPSQDLAVMGRLAAEHMIWRRYDTSFAQALTVEAGVNAEAGYHSDVIAMVGYEHRWRFDPRLEFHYGLQLSRRVYDGEAEKTAAVVVGLRARF